jgi:homopolymeric O-antigen transport system permease protein
VTLYADLFRHSDLFLNLFRRELRVKYRGSVLGLGWTLVLPLALMAVYTVVFSVLLGAVSIKHYPLFLLSGGSSSRERCSPRARACSGRRAS